MNDQSTKRIGSIIDFLLPDGHVRFAAGTIDAEVDPRHQSQDKQHVAVSSLFHTIAEFVIDDNAQAIRKANHSGRSSRALDDLASRRRWEVRRRRLQAFQRCISLLESSLCLHLCDEVPRIARKATARSWEHLARGAAIGGATTEDHTTPSAFFSQSKDT